MLNVIAFPGTTRRPLGLRAVGAVLAGGSSIFLVSALLDGAVRASGLSDPHYVIAFIAHSVVGALGCSLTAWLAPRSRAEHLIGLTALAFALSILAAAALRLSWLPLTLMASVLPAALLGSNVDSARPR